MNRFDVSVERESADVTLTPEGRNVPANVEEAIESVRAEAIDVSVEKEGADVTLSHEGSSNVSTACADVTLTQEGVNIPGDTEGANESLNTRKGQASATTEGLPPDTWCQDEAVHNMKAETCAHKQEKTTPNVEVGADATTDPDLATRDTDNAQDRTGSKYAPLRDLVFLGLTFTFVFSSYASFESLQSSLNLSEGLGTTSLTILYTSFLLTNLFLTPLTLSRVSYKTAMLASLAAFVIYVATGFKPTWATVVPASVLIGMGAAHLWPAQQATLTHLADIYARNTGGVHDHAVALFTGIFFFFMNSSFVWGNLFSSLVFARTDDSDGTTSHNLSVDGQHCGRHLCPYTNISGSNLEPPTSLQITIYTSTCLAVTCLGFLTMACCLATSPQPTKHGVNICKNLQKVGHLLVRSSDQQLLVVSTIFTGIAKSFMTGDFTLAFVSCPYGVSSLGYVMVVYGSMIAVCSVLFGRLSKYSGTYVTFVLAFVVQVCVCATMLLWYPAENQYVVVFFLAGLLGMSDAIQEPMLAVLYSLHFKDDIDVALSSFRMLLSFGMAASFGYSHWLCMRHKLYIYVTASVASFCGMTALHFKHRKTTKMCCPNSPQQN